MRARRQVTDLTAEPFVKRELALVKVRCEAAQRRELSDLAAIFHGTICDVSLSTVTLEMQGKETKIGALQGLLAPYGAPPDPVPVAARCRRGLVDRRQVTRCRASPSGRAARAWVQRVRSHTSECMIGPCDVCTRIACEHAVGAQPRGHPRGHRIARLRRDVMTL